MMTQTAFIYGYNDNVKGKMFFEDPNEQLQVSGKEKYLEEWLSKRSDYLKLAEKAFMEMPKIFPGYAPDEEPRVIGGLRTEYYNVLEIPGEDPDKVGMHYYQKRETGAEALCVVYNDYRSIRFANGVKIEQCVRRL